MVENDQIQVQLRDALNSGDVDHVINILRDGDVDVDYRDVTHDLQTFLMRVCYVNIEAASLFAILELIFDKSPDVNIQDSWGRTVLMHACIANKPSIIDGLLEYENTDISVIDFEGNSALAYAVQNCDIYTLEDLLQHTGGSNLLSVHNAKGHSPYKIAEKSRNKQVIALFDTYINKTASFGDKRRKRRKPRNRDVIKHLPPAYSPSPERKSVLPSPRNPVQSPREPTLVSTKLTMVKNLETHEITVNTKCAIADKCESAPLTRREPACRSEVVTSLSLSSPKLARRHHKQDCLLTDTLLHNQSKKLPYFKGDNQTDFVRLDLPEYSLRRQRRPSISLPDLRNMSGSLVNSGNTTPTTDDGSYSPRGCSPTQDNSDNDDEVFSRSYPTEIHSSRFPDKYPYRRQFSENQILLPEINKGAVTLTTPRTGRKELSTLVKQRKFSTSDDNINRITASKVL